MTFGLISELITSADALRIRTLGRRAPQMLTGAKCPSERRIIVYGFALCSKEGLTYFFVHKEIIVIEKEPHPEIVWDSEST